MGTKVKDMTKLKSVKKIKSIMDIDDDLALKMKKEVEEGVAAEPEDRYEPEEPEEFEELEELDEPEEPEEPELEDPEVAFDEPGDAPESSPPLITGESEYEEAQPQGGGVGPDVQAKIDR